MKKPMPRRRRPVSTPPVPVHQLDHAVPTVIHHPEEKMTALGRWTHRVLQQPRRYSTWALVIAAGALAIFAGWSYATRGRSTSSEVWTKLDDAIKPEDRVDVAKAFPRSEVATWALLQAATQYFDDALKDMPNNRDVAYPALGKALALFDQVAREAPKKSFLARAAALGKARALEARNDLAKAIEQYQLLAETEPESPEADQARQLAAALKKPEAAAFYKDLYAYAPTKMTLPPFGTEKFNLPPMGPTSKSGATGQPPALPQFPLELAPPDVEVVKRKSAPAGGKSTDKSGLPNLPADVLSPRPAQSQQKAPR
jgi:hypothetical protein